MRENRADPRHAPLACPITCFPLDRHAPRPLPAPPSARSAACTPASTVDVERIFSQGRLTVSHLQHRFAPQKIADMVNVAADTRHGLLKPGTLLRHMQAQDRDVKKRSGATRSGIDQMLKEQGAQVKDKGKKRKRSPSVDSMVVDSTEEESEPDVVISAHRPRAPRASGQQRQRVAAVSAGPSTSRTRASTSPPFDPTILFYNLEGDEHPIPAGAPAA